MKILVVYSTYGGVARECAEMLKKRLADRHDVELVNGRENEIPDADNYDCIVIGSSIRNGSMNKKLKKYVKNNLDKLSAMPCAVYYCCGYTKLFSEYVETQLPKRFEPSLGYHLFGGELKPDKLTGFDKFAVRMMRSSIRSQDFEEDDSDHYELPEIIPENIELLAKDILKLKVSR